MLAAIADADGVAAPRTVPGYRWAVAVVHCATGTVAVRVDRDGTATVEVAPVASAQGWRTLWRGPVAALIGAARIDVIPAAQA